MMVHITRVTQVWNWTDAWIHARVKRLEQCHVVFRVSLSILIELHATHPSLSSKLGSPRRWYSHRFFVPRFTLFSWPPSVRIRTWLASLRTFARATDLKPLLIRPNTVDNKRDVFRDRFGKLESFFFFFSFKVRHDDYSSNRCNVLIKKNTPSSQRYSSKEIIP